MFGDTRDTRYRHEICANYIAVEFRFLTLRDIMTHEISLLSILYCCSLFEDIVYGLKSVACNT